MALLKVTESITKIIMVNGTLFGFAANAQPDRNQKNYSTIAPLAPAQDVKAAPLKFLPPKGNDSDVIVCSLSPLRPKDGPGFPQDPFLITTFAPQSGTLAISSGYQAARVFFFDDVNLTMRG
jgi:hypothetical protein